MIREVRVSWFLVPVHPMQMSSLSSAFTGPFRAPSRASVALWQLMLVFSCVCCTTTVQATLRENNLVEDTFIEELARLTSNGGLRHVTTGKAAGSLRPDNERTSVEAEGSEAFFRSIPKLHKSQSSPNQADVERADITGTQMTLSDRGPIGSLEQKDGANDGLAGTSGQRSRTKRRRIQRPTVSPPPPPQSKLISSPPTENPSALFSVRPGPPRMAAGSSATMPLLQKAPVPAAWKTSEEGFGEKAIQRLRKFVRLLSRGRRKNATYRHAWKATAVPADHHLGSFESSTFDEQSFDTDDDTAAEDPTETRLSRSQGSLAVPQGSAQQDTRVESKRIFQPKAASLPRSAYRKDDGKGRQRTEFLSAIRKGPFDSVRYGSTSAASPEQQPGTSDPVYDLPPDAVGPGSSRNAKRKEWTRSSSTLHERPFDAVSPGSSSGTSREEQPKPSEPVYDLPPDAVGPGSFPDAKGNQQTEVDDSVYENVEKYVNVKPIKKWDQDRAAARSSRHIAQKETSQDMIYANVFGWADSGSISRIQADLGKSFNSPLRTPSGAVTKNFGLRPEGQVQLGSPNKTFPVDAETAYDSSSTNPETDHTYELVEPLRGYSKRFSWFGEGPLMRRKPQKAVDHPPPPANVHVAAALRRPKSVFFQPGPFLHRVLGRKKGDSTAAAPGDNKPSPSETESSSQEEPIYEEMAQVRAWTARVS